MAVMEDSRIDGCEVLMELSVPVWMPAFWWRGAAQHVRDWVLEDPDQEDHREPRWSDTSEQRWRLIASTVALVGDELAAGRWTIDEDDDTYYGMVVASVPEPLTETERHIVTSWFSAGEAVCVDPWFEPITNGRHRLWNTLTHFGDRLVPVASDALGYATPTNTEVLGEAWPELYRAHVDDLAAIEWFDLHDPMNSRFAHAIDQAARGEHPAPR
ncbi:hypothetical protein QP572_10640 [Brevibacterium sp. UMB10442]|nr:hypothetical protein [Brevibacterium sp. UMB10442]